MTRDAHSEDCFKGVRFFHTTGPWPNTVSRKVSWNFIPDLWDQSQASASCSSDSFLKFRNLLPSCLYSPNMGSFAQHGTQRMGFYSLPLRQQEDKLNCWSPPGTKACTESLACQPAQSQCWKYHPRKSWVWETLYMVCGWGTLVFLSFCLKGTNQTLCTALKRQGKSATQECSCSAHGECKKVIKGREGAKSPSLSSTEMGVVLKSLSSFCLGFPLALN